MPEIFENGIKPNGGRHRSDDVETIQTLRFRVLGTKISLFLISFLFLMVKSINL